MTLNFSFGICFSMSFIGVGKLILSTITTTPKITANNKINFNSSFVIELKLPGLVFF